MSRHAPMFSLDFDVLSEAWFTAGKGLGQPHTHACVVADCHSLSYVGLRTISGSQPVCFRHFKLLDECIDISE